MRAERRRLRWRQNEDGICLVPNEKRVPIWCPDKSKSVPKSFDLVEACFCPHVPELDHAVTAHTAKLCIFCWVECDLLNRCRVALELRRKLHMRLFRIPYLIQLRSSGRTGPQT